MLSCKRTKNLEENGTFLHRGEGRRQQTEYICTVFFSNRIYLPGIGLFNDLFYYSTFRRIFVYCKYIVIVNVLFYFCKNKRHTSQTI